MMNTTAPPVKRKTRKRRANDEETETKKEERPVPVEEGSTVKEAEKKMPMKKSGESSRSRSKTQTKAKPDLETPAKPDSQTPKSEQPKEPIVLKCTKKTNSYPPKPSISKKESKKDDKKKEVIRSRSKDVKASTFSNYKIPKKKKPIATESTIELAKQPSTSAAAKTVCDNEVVIISENMTRSRLPGVSQDLRSQMEFQPFIVERPASVLNVDMEEDDLIVLSDGDYEPMDTDFNGMCEEQPDDDEEAEGYQRYDQLKYVVVFDTCSLINDPHILEDCVIRGVKAVIPRKVLDELDYQKTGEPHVARQSREVHRVALELLPTKLLVVEKDDETNYIPKGRHLRNDDIIIKCAEFVRDGVDLRFGRGQVRVFFVSEDMNCLLRASSYELECFNNAQLKSFLRSDHV